MSWTIVWYLGTIPFWILHVEDHIFCLPPKQYPKMVVSFTESIFACIPNYFLQASNIPYTSHTQRNIQRLTLMKSHPLILQTFTSVRNYLTSYHQDISCLSVTSACSQWNIKRNVKEKTKTMKISEIQYLHIWYLWILFQPICPFSVHKQFVWKDILFTSVLHTEWATTYWYIL